MYLIIFLVSLLASTIGAICGVGGGVFMKPSLDALGILPVNTITFLSTCTVVSMSSYNVLSNLKNGKSDINWNLTTFLAIGGAIGGVCGKVWYTNLKNSFTNPDLVGGYQALGLFVVVLITLIYTLNKSKLTSLHITNPIILIFLGFVLGSSSSFLGIGGGPMNLAVLSYFLSMDTKVAAQNSLYIILISQIASIIMSFVSNTIPSEFFLTGNTSIWFILGGMMLCGIGGGIIGKRINKKIDIQILDRLFVALIYVILALSVYNMMTKFF